MTISTFNSADAFETPSTEYIVQVERVLKGFLPGGTVVVRVPGSAPAGQPGLTVWGAPRFQPGERALLFLAPRRDGSYRVVHLGLGAFHQVEAAGRRLAVRDLSGMRELTHGALRSLRPLHPAAPRDVIRDFDRFSAWLEAGAGEDGKAADYLADVPAGAEPRASRTAGLSAAAPAWRLAGGGQLRGKGVEGIRWAFGVRTDDADAAKLLDILDIVGEGRPSVVEGLGRTACRAGGLVSVSGTWFGGTWLGATPGGAKALGGEVILLAAAGCFSPGPAAAAEVRTFVAEELSWAFRGDAVFQAPPAPGPEPAATPTSPESPEVVEVVTEEARTVARGYRARACGFDMNDNGVVGEPADCNVCDGVTRDPDLDGIEEDQIYVSCNAGADTATCGSPANPCRTINFAWNSRADGPGDGAEDIICFKGTCSETVTVAQPGIAGAISRKTTATAATRFQLPKNPAMLAGWDADNDGRYPPYDTSDTAVLDGNVNGNLALAIQNSGARSYVEYAHFTARDYGLGCPTESGFMKVAAGGGPVSHLYLHDLALAEINTACTSSSNRIVFNLFVGGTPVKHLAVTNVDVAGYGSYLVRGSGNGTGPYRFQNLSTRAKAPAGNQAFGIKLWDELTGIDVLDSRFDLDPDAWGPCSDSVSTPGCEPSYALTASPCSSGWTIANNEMIDWKIGIAVQPFAGSGFCTSRPIDNVLIDRNVIRNSHAPWRFGDVGISVQSGTTPAATAATVKIVNNFLSSTAGWEACIWSNAGNDGGPNPGSVTIAGNTCAAEINRHAAIAIGNVEGSESAFPQQSYVLKNNAIAGLAGGQRNLDVQYRPASWDADFNVYDPDAGFAWNGGSSSSLAGWRTASGRDAAAKSCNPAFVNGAAGDFHLASGDVCARNAGTPLSSVLTIDFDGDSRGLENAWDIGADEVRAPL